jgi:hypothetical protein
MSKLKAVINVVIDAVKLILIFAVCLIVALVGSYLLGVWVGLIQKDSEYYRPLSIDTVMNDLPFIGTNMVYIIAFLLLLGVIALAAWGYDRYYGSRAPAQEKPLEKPLQQPEVKKE